MELWEGVLLGIVQGLTEFLPVSSSGHLVLAREWLGVTGGGLTFEVMVHFGTLFAVLVALQDDWRPMLQGLLGKGDPSGRRRLVLLIVGSIPIGIVGVFFREAIEPLFAAPRFVGAALIGTGTILWLADRRVAGARGEKDLDSIGVAEALLIGVAQALAVLPGISRSGATIGGGLFAGLDREAAARFAFLLAIPAIAGATLFEIPDLIESAGEMGLATAAGAVAAAVSGYVAIRTFLAYLRKGAFRVFSYYTWAVGLLALWLL